MIAPGLLMTEQRLAEIRGQLVIEHGSIVEAARVDARAELLAEVDRLRARYETSPTLCNRGHVTPLPMALWDCPTCAAELLAAAMKVAQALNPPSMTVAVNGLRALLTARGALGWPGEAPAGSAAER